MPESCKEHDSLTDIHTGLELMADSIFLYFFSGSCLHHSSGLLILVQHRHLNCMIKIQVGRSTGFSFPCFLIYCQSNVLPVEKFVVVVFFIENLYSRWRHNCLLSKIPPAGA